MGLCNTCEKKRSGKCEGNKPWEVIVMCEFYQKYLPDTDVGESVTNPNRLTNADRIRAMSDEDLAKYLFDRGNCTEYCYGICAYQDRCRGPYSNEFCLSQIETWLKQEVEM